MTNPSAQTRSITIIRWTFFITFLAVAVYCIGLSSTISGSESLGILFVFIFYLGIALFIESIVFAIIFLKSLKQNWLILLMAFVPASVIPFYVIKSEVFSTQETISPYIKANSNATTSPRFTRDIDSVKLRKYLGTK